ncbi:MAG TPA: hypothetical protein VN887_16540 [Candidatus Angelobacter sp.]|nr:hypothetical protein [Candidatus Angelobacter sp.]
MNKHLKGASPSRRLKFSRDEPYFLNVDLEITSTSKLDTVIAEMSTRVVVLYSGPAAGKKKHLLVLESSRQHGGPDTTIHALCSVIEALSPAARRILNAAQKEFDVGYELRASERSSRFTLRPDTLERVARLGAALAVSYYRGRCDDDTK